MHFIKLYNKLKKRFIATLGIDAKGLNFIK